MRRISPLSWVLIVIGVLFLILGIIYLTTTAPDLPGFIPGSIDHAVKRARTYSKRGIAALLISLGCFIGVYYNDFRNAR